MGNSTTRQIAAAAEKSGEISFTGLKLDSLPLFKTFKIELANITIFNAEDNNLNSVPKDIGLLVNLKKLILSEYITRFSTPPLAHLENIQLSFNPLVEVEDNLELAPCLESLACYSCRLQSVPVNSLKRMPKLTMIVNSNSLSIGHSYIPPEILCQLLGINDQKVPSEIIEEFLYLGSVESAKNWEGLLERKITHIVCMIVKIDGMLLDSGIENMKVDSKDIETADIKKHFPDINEFLDSAKKEGGRVLVHCAAGVSRSASAVLAYIMVTQGVTYKEAFELVSQRRPCIYPNTGFEQQLIEFEGMIARNNLL